jgi:hypothetical protein
MILVASFADPAATAQAAAGHGAEGSCDEGCRPMPQAGPRPLSGRRAMA